MLLRLCAAAMVCCAAINEAVAGSSSQRHSLVVIAAILGFLAPLFLRRILKRPEQLMEEGIED